MSSRINRYISREILIPTGMGLLIFTFVLLMGRILKLVEMVISKGVPFSDIARLFLSLLPAFLVITLPLAFLLGILLAFGRLSADSETIAMKASGLSLYDLLKPVLLLSIGAVLATGFLTLYAEPAGNAAFRTRLFQIASSRASVGLQPRVFNDDFDGLMLYTDSLQERTGLMEGIFIADERLGESPSIIVARQGRFIADEDALLLTLRLEKGAIHRRPQPANPGRETYQIINFSTYDINLNMGQQIATPGNRPRKAKELSLRELVQAQREADGQDRRKLTAELHQRFILPFAPLLFALVAVPLGIQTQRSGRGGGFAIGLFVFLAYYLLLSFSETLAVKGAIPNPAILWLPNLLFLTGGGVLFRFAAREKPLTFLDRAIGQFKEVFRRPGRR